jgi:hypothetical protein
MHVSGGPGVLLLVLCSFTALPASLGRHPNPHPHPWPTSTRQPTQALTHHIREEEEEMLVEFASLVDRSKLADLSRSFQASKAHVPTR